MISPFCKLICRYPVHRITVTDLNPTFILYLKVISVLKIIKKKIKYLCKYLCKYKQTNKKWALDKNTKHFLSLPFFSFSKCECSQSLNFKAKIKIHDYKAPDYCFYCTSDISVQCLHNLIYLLGVLHTNYMFHVKNPF